MGEWWQGHFPGPNDLEWVDKHNVHWCKLPGGGGWAQAKNMTDAAWKLFHDMKQQQQQQQQPRQHGQDKSWFHRQDAPPPPASTASSSAPTQAAPSLAPPASTWAERKAAGFQRQKEYEAALVAERQPQPQPKPRPHPKPQPTHYVDLEPDNDAPAFCSKTRANDLAFPHCFLVF